MRVLRGSSSVRQLLRSGVRAIEITTKPAVNCSRIFDISGVPSTIKDEREAGVLCCASRPHNQLATAFHDRSADVLGCCTQLNSGVL